MSDYLRETSVERVAEHLYRGRVASQWNIADNPNGGYLLSIAIQALQQTLEHPEPLSVTAHYLRPGIPDTDCEVTTEVLRKGRTISTARATLSQAGKERLELICAFGDLSVPASEVPPLTMPQPAMPPPDECLQRSGDLQGINLAIDQRLDVRLHPEQAQPGKAEQAEVSGWIRFLDGTEPSPQSLLLFVDSFPPSVIPVMGVVGWVPTIELTVHIRKRPAPGWVMGQFRTDDLADGRGIESSCLWDSEGSLVAQGRQLCLVLPR